MINPKEIFISYAWGGDSEDFVNQLDQAFQNQGISIIRDKRDLGYKGLIKEFMENIGRGKCVIAVISDKYLKSPNCMFELVQVAKHGQFFDRIFPILLADAQIYDPVQRLKYIRYWEDKKKELNEAIKEVSAEFLQGIREEIDQYAEIRITVAELTSILKNMNTLTPSLHSQSDFEDLIKAIDLKLKEQIQDLSQNSSDTSQIEDNLASECDIDYTSLEGFLKRKQWKEANEETIRLLIRASGREGFGSLDGGRKSLGTLGDRDIMNLPCQDLNTIDRLWERNSNGRFGFSTQSKIYQDEKDWESFAERVGWYSRNELVFSLSAPLGHLPTPPPHYSTGLLYWNVATILIRLEQCKNKS